MKRGVRLAVAALLATSIPLALHDASPASAAVPRNKKVYFVTESVGLGARNALYAAFPSDWQVTVDGTPALFVEQLESKHVRSRMATTPDVFGDYAVVAGGHNYPYWDPARFDRSIDSMIETLRQAGVKHIFWVTLREVKQQYVSASAWAGVQQYNWYFPIVNAHLRAALDRHPDLTLIDWTAIADRPGLTYDAIHLNTYGAAEYAGLVARTVQATATRLDAGTEREIDVSAAGAPTDAAAVALNLTVTGPRNTGYVTAYPCGGERPVVSSLNFVRDQTVAAAAIVPVGAGGRVCVYVSEATQLIVDLTGWFPAGAGFSGLTPERVIDTRSGPRRTADTPLAVPVAAGAAVALNITAVDPATDGYVTVHPCGSPLPPTSTVNVRAGSVAPNVAVVAPGAHGTVCVVPSTDMHLLVDQFGTFEPAADVELPDPVRAYDSRSGDALAAGTIVRIPVTTATSTGTVSAAAGAAVTGGALLNLTATGTQAAGYLTAFPCDGPVPPSSNLNTVTGRDVANFAAVAPGPTGEVCVLVSAPTHLLVDVVGNLGTTFTGTSPARLFDSRTA